MASFGALERLQKFDWLIQRLHSLRSPLQHDKGLDELRKLQALQLLHKPELMFHQRHHDEGHSGSDGSASAGQGQAMHQHMEEDSDDIHNIEELEEDIEEEDIEEDEEMLDEELEKDELEEGAGDTPNKEEHNRDLLFRFGAGRERNSQDDCLSADRQSDPKHDIFSPFSQHRYDFHHVNNGGAKHDQNNGMSRFSTGLFPPLPFKEILPLLENSAIKVGTFFHILKKLNRKSYNFLKF